MTIAQLVTVAKAPKLYLLNDQGGNLMLYIFIRIKQNCNKKPYKLALVFWKQVFS